MLSHDKIKQYRMIRIAALAQLVEQPPCKRQVVGAEPTRGSTDENLWKVYFSKNLKKWCKCAFAHAAPRMKNKKMSSLELYFYF